MRRRAFPRFPSLMSLLMLAIAAPAFGAENCRALLAGRRVESGVSGVYFSRDSFAAPARYAVADAKKAETLLQLFSEVSAALEKKGTTLVVVPVPPKPVVMYRYLSPDSQLQREYRHDRVKRLYLRFVEALNARGVIAVEVLTPLWKFDWRRSVEFPNMANEQHWSATGAKLSAEAVAARLAETEKFRSLPKVALRLRSEEEYVLASGVTLRRGIGQRFQDLCGLQLRPEKVPQFSVDDPETTLFSEVTAPVLLIGTSYSSNIFSFDKFLAASLQQRVLKVAGPGLGMFGGIERILAEGYLKSDTQYLVWEYPFLDMTFSVNTPEVIVSTLRQIVAHLEADCTGVAKMNTIPVGANGDLLVDIPKLRPRPAGKEEYLIVDVKEPVGEFRIYTGTDPAPLYVVKRNPRAEISSGRYYFKVAEGHLPRTAIRIQFTDAALVQDKTIAVALCGGKR